MEFKGLMPIPGLQQKVVFLSGRESQPMLGDEEKGDNVLPKLLKQGWRVASIAMDEGKGYAILTRQQQGK